MKNRLPHSNRLQPLRDGAGLFHDEPHALAVQLEVRELRLIEQGWWDRQIGILPYMEEEAIARLRHELGSYYDEKERKRDNWEAWRNAWVGRARHFKEYSEQGPFEPTTVYCAAEVLTRAHDLREAINNGQAEKAAALAMLIASWMFVGGISIRLAHTEPVATRHREVQRARANKPRTTMTTDSSKLRKKDLVDEALKAAGREAGTGEVWPHLLAALDRYGMSPRESGAKDAREISATDVLGKPVRFTFRGIQTMLRELRGSNAAKRGRPRKKPE